MNARIPIRLSVGFHLVISSLDIDHAYRVTGSEYPFVFALSRRPGYIVPVAGSAPCLRVIPTANYSIRLCPGDANASPLISIIKPAAFMIAI